MKQILKITLIFLLIQNAFASKDLSSSFYNTYNAGGRLTEQELSSLNKLRIVLIPGILAETFLWGDRRGILDLSILTSDYFGAQKLYFKQEYSLDIIRLKTSSKTIDETKIELSKVIDESRKDKKKLLLISHSLGGLALLEHLVERPLDQEQVSGTIFFQSPFMGTPIASVYMKNPYYLRSFLRPILPYVHTSEETIQYLSVENRQNYMMDNKNEIQNFLKKVPSITVAGVANGYKSLFKPAVQIMKSGCIKKPFLRSCLSQILYKGKYDLSDGMVPLESSKLEDTNFVILKGVDHGETVVNVIFNSINRARMTESLIKLWMSPNQTLN